MTDSFSLVVASFEAAILCNPEVISITSFNEWHEGSQIEKSVPKTTDSFKYLDFSPHPPNFYLTETKKHIQSFASKSASTN